MATNANIQSLASSTIDPSLQRWQHANWFGWGRSVPDAVRWGFWFAILNLIDGFQTMLIVGRFGLQAEMNPWVGWWIAKYSFAGLWFLKLSIMAFVLLMIKRVSVSILQGISLGLAAIVLMNFLTSLNRLLF